MQTEQHNDRKKEAPEGILTATPPFKSIGTIIHLAAWTILFCMPFFATGRHAETVTPENYPRLIIIPLSFMLVFYINYFILVKQFMFRNQFGRFILSNLILITVVSLSVHFLMQLFPHPLTDHPRPPKPFFFGNVILYGLIAALSVAIKMTNNWYRAEAARKELEKNQSEAELQNLKSQLNPHFLFNTLNNIYSLIAISPDKAQESVHDLSRLLRYVLYESSQAKLPLGKDLDFITNYVELMKIRLPQHVKVELMISDHVHTETPIAPLLFISLVENAFKHGVSHNLESFISIQFNQERDMLVCHIQNSYFPKEELQDKSGSGIGLQNLQKRLALLYPHKHMLSCKQENESYQVTLRLQLT